MKKYSTLISFIVSNLIILILCFSVLFLGYRSFQTTLNNSTKSYTTTILNQLSQTFDEKISIFNKVFLDITNNTKINSLVNHEIPLSPENLLNCHLLINRLSEYKLLYSFIDSLYVYFPDSELLISNETCYSSLDAYKKVNGSSFLGSEKNFLALLESVNNLTYYSPSDSPNLLSMIIPFHMSSTTKNSPYIILNLHSSFISNILEDNIFDKDYGLFIFDNQDQLIFNISQGYIANMLQDIHTPSDLTDLYLTLDTNQYSLSFVDSDLINWKYFFIIPTALFPPATLDLLTLAAAGILSLLCIACGILLALRNYSPIKKLVSLTHEITDITSHSLEDKTELDYIATSLLTNYAQYHDLKADFHKRLPDLQHYSLEQALNGLVIDWHNLELEMQSLQIIFSHPIFYIVCLEISPDSSQPISLLSVITLKLKDFILLSLTPKQTVYGITLSCNRICFIFNTSDDTQTFYNSLTQLHKVCKNFLQDKLMASLSLGCSEGSINFNQLPTLYTHALTSLEYQLINLPDKICLYEELPTNNYTFYYPPELESRLIAQVKLGQETEVITLITSVILENISNNHLSLETSKCLFFSLMGTAIKTINLLSINISDVFQFNPYEQLVQCTNLMDMEVLTREIFTKICRYIKKITAAEDNLSALLLTYLKENFSNPELDLNHLANQFNLSPNYLSRYFKEIAGYNFMSYLTELRLSHAKELLLHSDKSIKEIASLCGYPNSAGLIRNFKKLFGITPGQYRADSLTEN